GNRYRNASEMMADLRACLAATQAPLIGPVARTQTGTLKLPAGVTMPSDGGTEVLSATAPGQRATAETQTQLLTSILAARRTRPDM
ncbi:hypothetical protein ABTH50_19935, partial [Acinetobacter baumannii]